MKNIQNLILDNYDLSDYKIERVLSTACAKNIDFAFINEKSFTSYTRSLRANTGHFHDQVGLPF